MTKIVRLGFLVALTLVAQFTANAADRTIDCDAGDTIEAVLSRLRPGHILLVNGTCNENIFIEQSDITLDGQGTATINGPDLNAATVTIGASRVNVTGFTITGGNAPMAFELPVVTVPDDTADIVAAVASLSSGGTVFVRSQVECYAITNPIHINQSNIALLGERGACLRLADQAKQPVILIGSSSPTVSEGERIFDVRVSGFNIDGNKDNQDAENADGFPNIKVNGIAVRGAERVWLNQLYVKNARSGGIVISQQSRKVFIQDVLLYGNFFDGIAVDGGHEVLVENFVSEHNGFSGVSIDTGSTNLLVQDGLIQKNGDNGIFVRFTRESRFKGLSVTDNCNFGVFASHAADNGQEGVVELVFSDLELYRNNSAGFHFGSSSAQGSVDNVLMGTRVAANAGGDIVGGTGLQEAGNLVFTGANIGPTNRTCP